VRLGETDPFTLGATDLAAFRAKRIGFIFQEHHLLPQCTALENVLLARLAVGRVDPEHVERAEGLLERVGIANRKTHFPGELSGGERQRVAIARALMNHPALLLCDEPTGNLDAKTSQTVADLLLRVARSEQTILVAVTHSAAFSGVFDRRMRMEEGRLVEA
jgi:lipoprotein-releasing system ATP-binding protein